MFALFSKNQGTSICVESQETAVLLAAKDLQRDLCRLSNHTQAFPLVAEAPGAAIRISTGDGAPDALEGYRVRVSAEGVEITGHDTLGTVYGIYSFCDKVLNIPPMHLFTDMFPESRDSLTVEDADYFVGAPKTRFRGWFINDEDLLTEFKTGGGNRYIDYPFYDHVIHPDVLDMMLETALRCGVNLIIPSSFVNITNPDEEKLIRAACDRGLYVSQHHVEPMGVSYFGAQNYLNDRGLEPEVSYVSNPARMEEIWRHFAKKWAVYGKHVVWQLGLRGKGDKAVWRSDPNVPGDMESRGAIISNAIALQRRIVAETLGTDDFEATTTLWAEGAELYSSGALKLPEKTTAVFCDIGCNLMFGDDFYQVPRREGQRYGVYYHVAYWGRGPHLAEGCNPEKMAFSYREAAQRDSLYYSILNVTNIRPVHFSAQMNLEVLKDPMAFDPEDYLLRFYRRIYEDVAPKVVAGMQQYYRCFADHGEAELKRFCKRCDFHYHKYQVNFMNYAGTDGQLFMSKKEEYPDELLPVLRDSAAEFEKLLEYWKRLAPEIPAGAKEYFAMYQQYQTEYMLLATRWAIAMLELLRQPDAAGVAKKEAEGNAIIEEILQKRKILEQGKWEGWFRGDTKIGIDNRIRGYVRRYADMRLKQLTCNVQ